MRCQSINEARATSSVPSNFIVSFSLGQMFRACVRTASGSDRAMKPPRINNGTSRKRITENRAEMSFAVHPDPVATARGSDPPAKRRGYGKIISNCGHYQMRRLVSLER